MNIYRGKLLHQIFSRFAAIRNWEKFVQIHDHKVLVQIFQNHLVNLNHDLFQFYLLLHVKYLLHLLNQTVPDRPENLKL